MSAPTLAELADEAARMQSAGRKVAAVVANPAAVNLLQAENAANARGDVRLKRGGYTLFGCDVVLDFGCTGIVLLDADDALAYETAAKAAEAARAAPGRFDTPAFFRDRAS